MFVRNQNHITPPIEQPQETMGGGDRRDRESRVKEYQSRSPNDATVGFAQKQLTFARENPKTVGRVAGGAFGGIIGGYTGGIKGAASGAKIGFDAGERAAIGYVGEEAEHDNRSFAKKSLDAAGGVADALAESTQPNDEQGDSPQQTRTVAGGESRQPPVEHEGIAGEAGAALGQETARRLAAGYADSPDDQQSLDSITGYTNTVAENLRQAGYKNAGDLREASVLEIVQATGFPEQDARDVKLRL